MISIFSYGPPKFYNCISAPEGCKDFSRSEKQPQQLQLYRGCESAHTLKCLLFEKIANKICFSQFSRNVSIFNYKLLHDSNLNVAILVTLMYKKSLYNSQELRQEMNVKLCTLIYHDQVNNTSNFNIIGFISREIWHFKVAKEIRIAIYSKFVEILICLHLPSTLNASFCSCYGF